MEYPKTDSWVYATAIVIPVLSGLACVISIVPLIIYVRASNIPVSVLFSVVVIQNLIRFINALLWPRRDSLWWWNGIILCDIQAKLIIGLDMASSSSVACLFRQLAAIMDSQNRTIRPSKAQKRQNLAVEVVSCFCIPVLVMALHYIVQPQRYYLYPIHGCTSSIDASWPTYVILCSWPAVTCIAATTYGVLTITRMIRHRRETGEILSRVQNSTDQRQFTRLFVLAMVTTVLFIPMAVFRSYFRPIYWYSYSWNRIHPSYWSNTFLLIPSYNIRQMVVDLIESCSSFVLFACFSFGREPEALYKNLYNKVTECRLFRKTNAQTPDDMPGINIGVQIQASKNIDDTELVLLGLEGHEHVHTTTLHEM